MHKWLVAGLSRLVTCLQSNFIGTNFTGFCSNLGVRGLFSYPFVSYWVHIDWLAPGYLRGAGNPTISRETETQVRAAWQSRQSHIPPVFVFMEGPIMGLLYHLWGQSNIEIWVTLGGRTGSVFFLTTLPWDTSYSRCFLGFGAEVSFFWNFFLLCLGIGLPSRAEVSLYLT